LPRKKIKNLSIDTSVEIRLLPESGPEIRPKFKKSKARPKGKFLALGPGLYDCIREPTMDWF
jgi:hypothetical protein